MTSTKGHQIIADVNKVGWENSDFPNVCETCLGENPYVRMIKESLGDNCKICERPYTLFRWKPGPQARIKKTIICQTCSKQKHVCQVCMFDLTYGLPVQVRDKILREEQGSSVVSDVLNIVPQSDTMRQYQAGQAEALIADGTIQAHGKAKKNETLMKLARKQPYYKRNLPRKCTFFARGECKRGSKCPFLHEMPSDKSDPLANQNIQDRFYGTDDPVAEKILSTVSQRIRKLNPPSDESITTLWIGGIDDRDITEDDIHSVFYIYGEIKGIRLILEKQIAFVEYESRKQAEKAAEALYEKLAIKDRNLRLKWAEKQQFGNAELGKKQNEAGLLGAGTDGYKSIQVNSVTTINSTLNSNTHVLKEAKIPIAPDLFKNLSTEHTKAEKKNVTNFTSTSGTTVKSFREKIDGEEGEVEEVSDEDDEVDNEQNNNKGTFIPPLPPASTHPVPTVYPSMMSNRLGGER